MGIDRPNSKEQVSKMVQFLSSVKCNHQIAGKNYLEGTVGQGFLFS